MSHSEVYTKDRNLQEAHDKDHCVILSRNQARKLREEAEKRLWSNEIARQLKANRREKKKGTKAKVATLLAAAALGVGVASAKYLHDHPVVYEGKQMYQVLPGDTLEQILLENVEGINDGDYREVEYDVRHNPDNADVFEDSNGDIINPGDIIEIPEKVVY